MRVNRWLALAGMAAWMAAEPGAWALQSPPRAPSLGSVTFTGVSPRILTPNGDGANDRAAFRFDNPDLLPLTGRIYDLSGGRVTTLSGGADPTAQLSWDGKDADGRPVAGGIYLYEIDLQGDIVTGTVIVAR